MAYSGMLRLVALVKTDVSEELTRATRRNIPEDAIIHNSTLSLNFSETPFTYGTEPRASTSLLG
jgi:hypothetical protein